MVNGIPVLTEDEQGNFRVMSEILVLPGEEIPVGASIPDGIQKELGNRFKGFSGQALELGEIKWWRGHRIVSYKFSPIRHDGLVAYDVLESGSWDVVFEMDKQVAGTLPKGHSFKSSSLHDERISGFLLNDNLLASLPTEAAYQGPALRQDNKSIKQGGKSGTLLGPVEGRLLMQQTRLHRVTASRLRTLGYLPDTEVEERHIRLYQRRYLERLDDGSGEAPYVEIEVPIKMFGEGDLFEGDDFFIFHGLRLRDDIDFMADVGMGEENIFGCGDIFEMKNKGNIYWVAASEPEAGQSWARMAEQSISPAGGTPVENYRRIEHHEEQVSYRQAPLNIEDDRLFLNHYSATEVSVGFSPLWSPDPAGGAANIEFQIAGFGATMPDMVLDVELVTDNSLTTTLEDCVVEGNVFMEKSYSFSADALAGSNSKLVLSRGGSWLFSWLNWAVIEYDALYQATGNKLTFHGGETNGTRPLVVTGFTSDDIGLIEITDPRNPVYYTLDSSNILADGNGYKVSLEAVQTDGARHFVATGSFSQLGVGEFNYYESSKAENQVNPVAVSGVDPDLLVVTHPEFRQAIEPWIAHREARACGQLDVHVVEVQDIYDWYSGGLKDPWAIKRFANHAVSQWGTWSMMLVGDANENALELGVASGARGWSRDWVPTHHHVQIASSQYPPEVLASDKWYATFDSGMNYPEEDFPNLIYAPWQMYVGRFPCNSVAELNNMINKVILVETPLEGQDWRKKTIFFADDHWSNGYAGEQSHLYRKSAETAFADVERDIMAPLWTGGSPVTLDADTLFLDNYLKPIWIAEGSVQPREAVRYQDAITESNALTDLLTTLSGGALMAHYQGHANSYLLCSEYWFQDMNRSGFRNDVQSLTNSDSPWVFFGMGCHVSDWAQDTVAGYYPTESSLGEKFLTRVGGGASATYGSSGYEYVDTNEYFGEYLMKRWINLPPNASSAPDGAPAGVDRSRWMLGELLLYSEADVYPANSNDRVQEMISQFTLLGDPLMVLDAGPPVVSAVLTGQPDEEISGEVDLLSSDVGNLRIINVEAKDEAGISRLRVIDSTGLDMTASVVTESLPDGEDDHQQVNYRLDVPLRPFDHQIMVEVFDTGANQSGDRHYTLVLNVGQEAVFTESGEEVDPAEFHFVVDEPLEFQCEITSGAWLDDSSVFTLAGKNLLVENFIPPSGKSNSTSFSFTATATSDIEEDRSIVLGIDGFETTHVLSGSDCAQSHLCFHWSGPELSQSHAARDPFHL